MSLFSVKGSWVGYFHGEEKMEFPPPCIHFFSRSCVSVCMWEREVWQFLRGRGQLSPGSQESDEDARRQSHDGPRIPSRWHRASRKSQTPGKDLTRNWLRFAETRKTKLVLKKKHVHGHNRQTFLFNFILFNLTSKSFPQKYFSTASEISRFTLESIFFFYHVGNFYGFNWKLGILTTILNEVHTYFSSVIKYLDLFTSIIIRYCTRARTIRERITNVKIYWFRRSRRRIERRGLSWSEIL